MKNEQPKEGQNFSHDEKFFFFRLAGCKEIRKFILFEINDHNGGKKYVHYKTL